MKFDLRFSPVVSIVAFALLTWLAATIASAQSFSTSNRLLLGTDANKSASVRLGDLDGDKDLDIVVANGRHWPQQNFAFINQSSGRGRPRFTVMRPVGVDRSTTYACELADLDGDGDLDIATGNDMAACQVLLNDGKGQFELKDSFGEVSSVRSLAIADFDKDGDHDILVTCRGRANSIYLNDGSAGFETRIKFGTATDSTIDVEVGDVNGDGHNDLVLANRDGQQNSWLLNNGKSQFSETRAFGNPKSQSRAVTVGDFNGDDKLDWAIGNIGQQNRLYLGDGTGGVSNEIKFGDKTARTYCLASADLDLDGDLDLIAGQVGQRNSVFFNNGNGTEWREEKFGGDSNATYGLSVGDLNGDKMPDIAVANSDATNHVFINRIKRTEAGRNGVAPRDDAEPRSKTVSPLPPIHIADLAEFQKRVEYSSTDWPAFRGLGGRGVAEGFPLPTSWNADAEAGDLKNVLWQTEVPGLGHSSPVIDGNKLFLLTAVASEGDAPLKVESGGKPTAADDNGVQDWLLLCYDTTNGNELWRRTLRTGKPGATRHAKATHANTSVVVADGKLVSFLGSEGLYCHELDGQPVWKQDLGVINISKYGIGWGFSSSPAVHDGHVVVVCDDPENPYLAARRLSDGEEVWRTPRKGICERSWGTPLIHAHEGVTQVVVNGWPWIVSYDLSNGKEIWRMKGGGDNPVPSPFEAHGLLYITNAHGGPSPIYAVRPSASGDISAEREQFVANREQVRNSPIVWSTNKGGSYMSTPVVYGNQIYLGSAKGIIRSFNAATGSKMFEKRLGRRAGLISSLVAGDQKIYCASENGTVYVLAHGPELKILAENQMGAPCMATPAIASGTLFFRTINELIAIKHDQGDR